MINRVRLDRFDYELKGSDPFNCETKLANDYQTPTILEKLRKQGAVVSSARPLLKGLIKSCVALGGYIWTTGYQPLRDFLKDLYKPAGHPLLSVTDCCNTALTVGSTIGLLVTCRNQCCWCFAPDRWH